jgi:hypothetical protein
MHDLDPFRFFPELPARSDKMTLQLWQLLHQLSRRFDDYFHEQIRRAHRARHKDRLRRSVAEKRRPYGPQSKLPEEFYARPSRRGRR